MNGHHESLAEAFQRDEVADQIVHFLQQSVCLRTDGIGERLDESVLTQIGLGQRHQPFVCVDAAESRSVS